MDLVQRDAEHLDRDLLSEELRVVEVFCQLYLDELCLFLLENQLGRWHNGVKDSNEEFIIQLLVEALHLDTSDSAEMELGAHGLVGLELSFHMDLIPEYLLGFFGGRSPS